MYKIFNPEFCEYARDYLDPDCSHCTEETYAERKDDWRDITLTGNCIVEHFQSKEPTGMFLEYTCNRCGRTGESGDADFFTYFHVEIEGMVIESK